MSQRPVEDVSIAEHSGHILARPVSWAVVVLVCAGFLAAGIALVVARPWLFFVGAGVVVLALILGWATHAMANVAARVETPARRANAAEAAHHDTAHHDTAHHDTAHGATAHAEGGTDQDRFDEPARH